MSIEIKDIKQFRTFFKNSDPSRNDNFYDENFIGTINNEWKHGMFFMFHGDKPIADFLKPIITMAPSSQAVYEFIQNAYDAGSESIHIYFKDNQLLIINDGEAFTYEAIRSILDIGASDKLFDKYSIGKFGIGFKLVYQLFGDNIEEVTENQNGPILFSWHNGKNNLNSLLNSSSNKIVKEEIEYQNIPNSRKYEIKNKDSKNIPAWLFKIINTCFPTFLDEGKDVGIRDNNFQPISPITSVEYEQFISFAKSNISENDLLKFSNGTGSLFYVKVGIDISDIFKQKSIVNGLSVSLNIFQHYSSILKLNDRKLNTIKINEHATDTLNIKFITVESENTHFYWGYMSEIVDAEKYIKPFSNFYLFFPLSSEKYKFNFIIHSNSFDIQSDRTILKKNNKNIKLLNSFVNGFKKQLQKIIDNKEDSYRDIFISILTSEYPDESNEWILKPLYSHLLDFIKLNIPVKGVDFTSDNNIVINITGIDIINPSIWGCEDYYWFYWNSNDIILNAAKDEQKLNIKSWTIDYLIDYTEQPEKISNWLKTSKTKDEFNIFLKELNDNIDSVTEPDKLNLIKFIAFGEELYSINEINEDDNDLFILNNLTEKVKQQILDFDFLCSSINFEKDYPNIYEYIKQQISQEYLSDHQQLIIKITEKIHQTYNHKNISKSIVDYFVYTIENIDDRIAQEPIFYNTENSSFAIIDLIECKQDYPKWLSKFMIHSDFVTFQEILPYYIDKEDIYEKILLNIDNWNYILETINDIYQDNSKYNLKQEFYQYIDEVLYHQNQDKISKKFNNNYILVETKIEKEDKTSEIIIDFKPKSQVFYHEGIRNSTLHKFTEDFISKPVNTIKIQSILSERLSAFYTQNDDIFDEPFNELNNLTKTQITYFLKFCADNRWNIFNSIYIEKYKQKYSIKKKEYEIGKNNRDIEPIQCLLLKQNKNLEPIITKEYYKDKIKLLDINFDNIEETGIVKTEIGELLIEKAEYGDKECLYDLIDFVEDWRIELKKLYLTKIDKLDLKQSINTKKTEKFSDYNYKVLKLAVNAYKEVKDRKEFSVLKSKIYLDAIPIKKIETHKNIKINQTDFNVAYEDLFNSLTDEFSTLTKIVNSFDDKQIEDKIFKSNSQTTSEVYEKFKETYENEKLTELQCSFVLLFKPEDITFYNVEEFEKNKLKIINFLYDNNFLKDNYIQQKEFITFFNLENKIQNTQYAYSVNEKLDRKIQIWINSDNTKISFLENFGVVTEMSKNGNNIINIRKFLTQKSSDDLKDFDLSKNPIAYQTVEHLQETLAQLIEKKFEYTEAYEKDKLKRRDNEKLRLIKNIYNNLYENGYDEDVLPILYIKSIQKKRRIFAFIENIEDKVIYYELNKYKDFQEEIIKALYENELIIEKNYLPDDWDIFEDENSTKIKDTLKTELKNSFSPVDAKSNKRLNLIVSDFTNETGISLEVTKEPLKFVEKFNETEIKENKNKDNSKYADFNNNKIFLYLTNDWSKNIKSVLTENFKTVFTDIEAVHNILTYFKDQSILKPQIPSNEEILKKYLFSKLRIKTNSSSVLFKYASKLLVDKSIFALSAKLDDFIFQQSNSKTLFYFYNLEALNKKYVEKIREYLSNEEKFIIPKSHISSYEDHETTEITINHYPDTNKLSEKDLWQAEHYIQWKEFEKYKIYMVENIYVNDFYNDEQLSDNSYITKQDFAFSKPGSEQIICLDKSTYEGDNVAIHSFLKEKIGIKQDEYDDINKNLNTDNLLGGELAQIIKTTAKEKGININKVSKTILDKVKAAFEIAPEDDSDEESDTKGPVLKGKGANRRNIGIKGEKVVYERLKKCFDEKDIIWYNKKEAEGQNIYKNTHSKKHCDLIVKKNDKEIFIECKATQADFENKSTVIVTKPEWDFFRERFKCKENYILIRISDLKNDKINEDYDKARIFIIPNIIQAFIDGKLIPYNNFGTASNEKIYFTFNTNEQFEDDICEVINNLTK